MGDRWRTKLPKGSGRLLLRYFSVGELYDFINLGLLAEADVTVHSANGLLFDAVVFRSLPGLEVKGEASWDDRDEIGTPIERLHRRIEVNCPMGSVREDYLVAMLSAVALLLQRLGKYTPTDELSTILKTWQIVERQLHGNFGNSHTIWGYFIWRRNLAVAEYLHRQKFFNPQAKAARFFARNLPGLYARSYPGFKPEQDLPPVQGEVDKLVQDFDFTAEDEALLMPLQPLCWSIDISDCGKENVPQ